MVALLTGAPEHSGTRGIRLYHKLERTDATSASLYSYTRIWFWFLTEEIQYHDGLRSRELGQAPILLCAPNSQAGVIISPAQTDGLTVLATGQRQYAKLVHYQPSYNTSHTMKSSDPLLLADGNLHCGMYPAGKVAISRHLVTPGFPWCDHTVGKLSADAGVH